MNSNANAREQWAQLKLAGQESVVVYSPGMSCAQGLESALWVMDVNTMPVSPVDEQVRPSVLPAGEAGKSWPAVEQIVRAAVQQEFDRDGVFVGFGGGVVCDVTAFAASIYLRGVDVVLVPTTLLAMVDAAIGGKTGINFAGYKNMIGTFHAAKEVRINPELLSTLPEREYRSGIAEVIKAAVLGDEALLSLLEEKRDAVLGRDMAVLRELIRRSIDVKVNIVHQDFQEQGIRATLNLGHTFAHALESVAGFGEWTHGEAVAWGIARAVSLGMKTGVSEEAHARRVLSLVESYGYRTEANVADPEALMAAMRHDKKRRGEHVRFVLSRAVGDTTVEPVDDTAVRNVLR